MKSRALVACPALLALALFGATFLTACNSSFPESHSVTLVAVREARGLSVGDNSVRLIVRSVPGEVSKVGGGWLDPIMQTPVTVSIALPDGSPVALFESRDMRHTHQTQQIEGMGRDNTREVDELDGNNADGVRLTGKITTEYAMHYVQGSARNAWLIRGDLELSDSSGPLGSIHQKEYSDW